MTQKRRGAPIGNQNALKHGYYAHTFRPAETRSKADGPPPESLADEIALIRVLIRRVVEKTTGQESMAESLEILRIVSMAASSLARLQRAQVLVSGGPQAELRQALSEAIDQVHIDLGLNFDQDPGPAPANQPAELNPFVFPENNFPTWQPAPAPDRPEAARPTHSRKRHRRPLPA